jgi:hypothetical protein
MKMFLGILLVSAGIVTLCAGELDAAPERERSFKIPAPPSKWEAVTWPIGDAAWAGIDEIARLEPPDRKSSQRTIAEKSADAVRLQQFFPDGSSTVRWVVNGFELTRNAPGQPISLAAAESESAVARGAVDLAELEWVNACRPVGQATVRGILCKVFEQRAAEQRGPLKPAKSMDRPADLIEQSAPVRRLAFIDETTGFPVRILEGNELRDFQFGTQAEKIVLPPEAVDLLSNYLRKLDRTFPRIPSQPVR